MTSESPTSPNAQVPETTQHCAAPRCSCPVKEGERYCNKACEDKSSTLNYCPCTHDGCYRECDLVMKGGITSGIVYPPLVYKLYENNFRFRCIGGTSAGAIGAVVTAAAEYGRRKAEAEGKTAGGAKESFQKLNEVKDQLKEGTFLRDLFQPSKKTRPLYDFLLGSAEVVKAEDGAPKETGVARKIWRVVRRLEQASPARFLLFFLAGASLALILALTLGWLAGATLNDAASVILVAAGLAGAALGYLGALIERVWSFYKILTVTVPDNAFGMCTGMPDEPPPKGRRRPKGNRVLTEWLHERIDDIAGLPPRGKDDSAQEWKPLTFGMLKETKFAKQQEGEEGIQLRMVTSNLSQNQPYILPFKDHLFVFKEDDFRKYFPKEIVDYMKRHPGNRPAYELPTKAKGKGYYFLPDADDLPVVVAMRLSLSFPLLLSAVPMYTIVPKKIEEARKKKEAKSEEKVEVTAKDLKKNWFSDGGIASNFPIQFFDTWLPTRPTFGVNLTSLPKESIRKSRQQGASGGWDAFSGRDERKLREDRRINEERDTTVRSDCNSPIYDPASQVVEAMTGVKGAPSDKENIRKAIYLPKANDPLYTEWIDFNKKEGEGDDAPARPSLFKFLWAIFTTAQNYRDNMQATLPSYRERIVQIRFSEEEGGLNLAMEKNTIQNVMEKGEVAGELLTKFDFEVHQWVRFRLLMSQMEQYMEKTYKVARQVESEGESKGRLFDYPQLIEKAKADQTYPFRPRDPKEPDEMEWGKVAQNRMKHMSEFIEKWEKDKPKLSEEPPLPESVLRIMPEL